MWHLQAAYKVRGNRVMRAVIDRIEGDIAVLLLGDEEIKVNLPLKYLPEGARESSILRLSFDLDRVATENALERARQRIARLRSQNPR